MPISISSGVINSPTFFSVVDMILDAKSNISRRRYIKDVQKNK